VKFLPFSFFTLHTYSSFLFSDDARMKDYRVDVIFVKFFRQVDVQSGKFACLYIEL
jgi:hypothetical protein